MTVQEAFAHLDEVLTLGLYHRDYERTLEVARFARAIMTGHDQEEMVLSVRRRETAEQQEQRVRLTRTLTPVAGRMVLRMFDKMRRVQPATREITFRQDEEPDLARGARKAHLIEERLNFFYASQPLEEYLFDRLLYFTFFDPNAFLIFERRNHLEGELLRGVQVYPVEVTSAEARMFTMRDGTLTSLLVERENTRFYYPDADDLKEFYLYLRGAVVHLVEYPAEVEAPALEASGLPQGERYTPWSTSDEDAPRRFLVHVYRTGTTEIPAIRCGAYLDGLTQERTAVTPMEPAHYLLLDLINEKSLYDLTRFLHTYPRRWAYAPECDYTWAGNACDNGRLIGEDGEWHTCPSCHGTGLREHAGEQDLIQIALPKGMDNPPELSRFAHVEKPDIDLVRHQASSLENILETIMLAVFNQEIYTRAQVAQTATEAMLNYQNVYDTLQPFAELYALAWEKGVRVTAQYLNIADGLRASFSFPADLQYETEQDLISRFAAARSAGLDRHVLDQLEDALLNRMGADEIEVAQARVWSSLRPWREHSEQMTATILASRAPLDYDRLLYENFSRIRRELERETDGRFYLMESGEQDRALRAKVAQIAEEIRLAAPSLELELDGLGD